MSAFPSSPGAPPAGHAPDPVLAASVYADRGLDGLVLGVAAPLLARLREADPGWSLWMVRYARGGEHLKLRLHGPAGGAEEARTLAAAAVEAHFAALPPADPAAERVARPDAPAIDPQDEPAGVRPDRALVWTTYRRSPVSLGPPRFLDDDGYAARITAALAAGAALVLEGLRPDDAGGMPGAARQRVLLAALIAGAGALPPEARAGYLAYHRDWLLRFALPDDEAQEKLLAHFASRTAAGSTAEQVRRAARAQWDEDGASADGPAAAWRAAVAALAAYQERFRGVPDVDPFTAEPAFPAVFKALHGTANAAGVGMLDEAYLHHLLLAAAGEPAGAVPAGAEA